MLASLIVLKSSTLLEEQLEKEDHAMVKQETVEDSANGPWLL